MLQDDSGTLQLFRLCYQGRVQGVGFRPLIWRLANESGLAGEVRNIGKGVELLLWATPARLDDFVRSLNISLPSLAQVTTISIEPVISDELRSRVSTNGVVIQTSEQGDLQTPILPDLATCPDCLHELFDPASRRYLYPFINCTHCGPRYSAISAMPFDREHTVYADFPMCSDCLDEYSSPEDRRFHAQGNVCSVCGPEVWIEDANAVSVAVDDPFAFLAERLKQGDILAIKGLGGFHLCCDAESTDAVRRLRLGKNRPAKALALMFPDLTSACQQAEISEQEARCLQSAQAPIVLCCKRSQPDKFLAERIVEEIAPDSHEFGVMLPYTPIHHLLLKTFSGPLVMTSGNTSGHPQVTSNEDARQQLSGVAQWFLMHNRAIQHRIDDTVMRVDSSLGGTQLLRPGRGMAPLSLSLPEGFASADNAVIALGGDLKNTFCLIKGDELVISPYMGDLSQPQIYQAQQQMLQDYRRLYPQDQVHWVADSHPGYLSTQWALGLKSQPLTQVQHHHAHLASCLLDNAYPFEGGPVLALCLDGSGYGADGSLWGGECLLGDYSGYKRLAHLKPFALPGGSAAVLQPWRLLLSQLHQSDVDWQIATKCWPVLGSKQAATLVAMIEQGVNSPRSSSVGRLFDAVASALGCYAEGISYEGQAAIKLEQLAWQNTTSELPDYDLPWSLAPDGALEMETRFLWQQLMQDRLADRKPEAIARAFHQALIRSLMALIERLAKTEAFRHVVLTGGVMQNRLLHEGLKVGIEQLGLVPMVHRQIPCNDSGISAGQAMVALARLQVLQQASM